MSVRLLGSCGHQDTADRREQRIRILGILVQFPKLSRINNCRNDQLQSLYWAIVFYCDQSFIVNLLSFFADVVILGAGARDVVPHAARPAQLHAVLHGGARWLAAAPCPPVVPGAEEVGKMMVLWW